MTQKEIDEAPLRDGQIKVIISTNKREQAIERHNAIIMLQEMMKRGLVKLP